LYISAEHGDGLPDLYKMIQEHVPTDYQEKQEDRKAKRVERFVEYKEMLLDEILKDREQML